MPSECWATRTTRALRITGIIASGLAFDQLVDFWGQTLTNVGIWAALLYWLRGARPDDQMALAVCILYATLGEIFLSLVWGLYEYRLANVPLFVPPGHALLFMLGRILAERAGQWIEWFVAASRCPVRVCARGDRARHARRAAVRAVSAVPAVGSRKPALRGDVRAVAGDGGLRHLARQLDVGAGSALAGVHHHQPSACRRRVLLHARYAG